MIFLKEESFQLIGLCFEVYNQLGSGFLEIVYKDALEYEFKKNNIHFQREKKYEVKYKDIFLPHNFHADFVVFNQIILEIKSASSISDIDFAQCINYLKVSQCKLALLVNFGEKSLVHKRIVL